MTPDQSRALALLAQTSRGMHVLVMNVVRWMDVPAAQRVRAAELFTRRYGREIDSSAVGSVVPDPEVQRNVDIERFGWKFKGDVQKR